MRAPYTSAPVILRKLLDLSPVVWADDSYGLDELLASNMSAEKISALLEEQHDIRVSATSVTRWRNDA